MNIIETHGLGKRYRRTWALRDCSLAIPAGSVVALVGHNGAGKTTLLNLLVGLIEPTEGSASVLGGERAGSPRALDAVGYVAQEAPLYQNLSVGDTLRVIASLNRRWDQDRAQARLAELGIPLDRRVRRMSGGQQAQLALTLALARRPRLLVLDEPLAMLDPLARFDFMDTVMTATSQDGISVVLSSHVLAELERVADYLVLLSRGRLQVAGTVKGLAAAHQVLCGPEGTAGSSSRCPRYTSRTVTTRLASWSTPTSGRATSPRAGGPSRPAWRRWSSATCASPTRPRCPRPRKPRR